MKKRGAHIRHRAASVPGLIAQSLTAEYETRLRMAVEAFRGGWATSAHFNDLADTLDLLQIGIAIYPAQRQDNGAAAACQVALVAMQNIRDRYQQRGRMGVSGEELKALDLLANTSLDYWNRRSGALFGEAYRQLMRIRKTQAENREAA